MAGKKMGRPKTGVKESRSVGFPPALFAQLNKLAELTGKTFPKIVAEGGEAVVAIYRKKGYDI